MIICVITLSASCMLPEVIFLIAKSKRTSYFQTDSEQKNIPFKCLNLSSIMGIAIAAKQLFFFFHADLNKLKSETNILEL